MCTAMRWSIDASLSSNFHYTRPFLSSIKFIYRRQVRTGKKKSSISSIFLFSSNCCFEFLSQKYKNIYIYISKIGIRRSFFKKTMRDLFATWKRTRFWKSRKAKQRVTFLQRSLFHSRSPSPPPIQTKFPRNSFHLVYLIIRSICLINLRNVLLI